MKSWGGGGGNGEGKKKDDKIKVCSIIELKNLEQ